MSDSITGLSPNSPRPPESTAAKIKRIEQYGVRPAVTVYKLTPK